jgi:three-Cys-motif partner protein
VIELEKLPFTTELYEEQTELKHKVFRDYFDKWVKIVGSAHKLNYIDGFAGLGAYRRSGKVYFGSPIIASEVVSRNEKNAFLIFIDNDKKVIQNLEKVIEYKNFSKELRFKLVNGDFNETIGEILKVDNIAPTFVFVDPFGFGDLYYDIIRNIMQRIKKPEIIITFMYNAVTRFMESKPLEKTIAKVFGTDAWKDTLQGGEREKNIIGLYVSQLRRISKFVFPYRLTFPDKNRTYYYLVHLTNHPLGASIMKSSFAKYSLGKVEWLGENSVQTSLADIMGIKVNKIKGLLIEKYNRQCASYEQIVVDNIDTTPYLESQLKDALRELESDGVVYIERFPKLGKNRRPLISIRYETKIYFNSFPSIERKSLLYETKVEYGNFTINHVFGCSHGCNYPCYAFMMAKSYGKITDYEDWIHPRIVSNALELLDREIPKYKDAIDFVHLCFSTDPFMYDSVNKRPFPVIKDLTLRIIEKLNVNGLKATVLTKGIYPEELTDKKRFSMDNEYGITLVSLKDKFKSVYEPFAAPFDERVNSLEMLHKKGLKTWVSIEPYPTENISKQEIEELLKRIAFVDKIIFGKMNYNPEATKCENNEGFYRECSEKVIDFCQKNKIQLHIKKGTPYSGANTKNLFRPNKTDKRISLAKL